MILNFSNTGDPNSDSWQERRKSPDLIEPDLRIPCYFVRKFHPSEFSVQYIYIERRPLLDVKLRLDLRFSLSALGACGLACGEQLSSEEGTVQELAHSWADWITCFPAQQDSKVASTIVEHRGRQGLAFQHISWKLSHVEDLCPCGCPNRLDDFDHP